MLSYTSCLGARSNDAFDAETGVDASKAESVVNLTGNRKAVLALANGFLVAGGLLLHSVTKAAVRCRITHLYNFQQVRPHNRWAITRFSSKGVLLLCCLSPYSVSVLLDLNSKYLSSCSIKACRLLSSTMRIS